jgi:CheY-like chemotaxis protein
MKSPASGTTVVIVEDEILVRAATARYLRECGCTVFEAATAEECLDLLAAERSIEVVFTDIRLPGRDGLDLLRAVRRDYPKVGVVLTTGKTLEAPIPDGVPLLQKPYDLFRIERLVASFRRAGSPRPP